MISRRFERCILAGLLACMCALPAGAAERVVSGAVWVFSNDALGDRKDRWRSFGFQAGTFTAPAGQPGPGPFGRLREVRLTTAIRSPASLSGSAPDDRAFAGTWELGLHGYGMVHDTALSAGAALVAIGPRTGWLNALDRLHGSRNAPGDDVRAQEIGNDVLPVLSAEAARPIHVQSALWLRPFVEARAGDETFVRAGADLVVASRPPVGARDDMTGQLLWRGGPDRIARALSIGIDAAHVIHSHYLPDGGAARLRQNRLRARAGALWQMGRLRAFYGLAWLGPEFKPQDTGQLVGSLSVDWRF